MADIFRDDFTVGTGTLSGRTVASGGTWLLDSPTTWQGDVSAPLTDLTLVGEGMQETVTGWQARGYAGFKPSQQPAALPFAVELPFTSYARVGNTQSFYSRFVVRTLVGAGANNWMGITFLVFIEYDPRYPTDPAGVRVEISGGAAAGNFYLDQGGTVYANAGLNSAFMGVSHSVVLRFYADRAEVAYDGVTIGTMTDPTSQTRYQSITGNSKNVMCEIGMPNGNFTDPHGTQYTSFRIYDAPPPGSLLYVDADFAGVNNTLVTNYTDLVGNHFTLPYLVFTGFTDINYTLWNGNLSGYNVVPSGGSPGGGDDRSVYADTLIPNADITVEANVVIGAGAVGFVWFMARSADKIWWNGSGQTRPDRVVGRIDFGSQLYLLLINDVVSSYSSVQKNITALNGTTMNMKLVLKGNNAKLLINDVEQLSLTVTKLSTGYAGWAGGTWASGPSPGDIQLASYRVYREVPAIIGFWTERQACTEVLP